MINPHSDNSEPEIQSELHKFIQLLQKGQLSKSSRSSRDMGKLSTILSASQPESSLGDKQNSKSSANSSYSSAQLMDKDGQLFKELENSGLSLDQRDCLEKVRKIVIALKGLVLGLQERYKALQRDYEKEKKGTDQLLKALIQMDEAEKEVWAAYNQLNENYKEQKLTLQTLENQTAKLKEKVQDYAKDNEFMKKLVIVANENYEILEKKCKHLQQENKGQQSARSMLQRSAKTKKQSYSPSGSDLANMSPRRQQFQGVYRKMVLRTLKSKCRKINE